jgi:3-oxoacyl-[acyl-carrier protein] reductase
VDLGIAGKWAVVCASSQGLGRACAEALTAEGVNVVINGRDAERLGKAAADLGSAHPVEVRAVPADITTAEGRAALLAACPEPDILVTNNAGPRPGVFTDVTEADMTQALDLHFHTPLALVRAVVDGMRARRFGRIVNITSAMVTTPNPFMAASSGARTGLTAVMKGLQRQNVRDNVTINQLARIEAERDGVTLEEARHRQAASIAAGRLGRPEEFGAACAFLCSAQAGYISGDNLHLDGGSYAGLV